MEKLIFADYDYKNNLYFRNFKLEVNIEGQKIIRKKLFKSLIDEEDLKVLQGILEYENGIKKLESAILKI